MFNFFKPNKTYYIQYSLYPNCPLTQGTVIKAKNPAQAWKKVQKDELMAEHCVKIEEIG